MSVQIETICLVGNCVNHYFVSVELAAAMKEVSMEQRWEMLSVARRNRQYIKLVGIVYALNVNTSGKLGFITQTLLHSLSYQGFTEVRDMLAAGKEHDALEWVRQNRQLVNKTLANSNEAVSLI